MSRIAQMAEEMKRAVDEDIRKTSKKTALSLRVDEFTIFCIELFAKEINTNKTAACQELLAEGVLEALEAIGYKMIDLQAMHLADFHGKPVEEMKEKLQQTGFFAAQEGK